MVFIFVAYFTLYNGLQQTSTAAMENSVEIS